MTPTALQDGRSWLGRTSLAVTCKAQQGTRGSAHLRTPGGILTLFLSSEGLPFLGDTLFPDLDPLLPACIPQKKDKVETGEGIFPETQERCSATVGI